MHIYQHFIASTCALLADICRPTRNHDFVITANFSPPTRSTILFPADQAFALRPAFERFAEGVDYRLPFAGVCDSPVRPAHPRSGSSLPLEYEDEQRPDGAGADGLNSGATPACPSTARQPADGERAGAALAMTQGEVDGVLRTTRW